MDRREMLVGDLGAIDGVVFTDLTGNGLTNDDPRVAGVEIQLFQDGGNGTFEGNAAGTDDTLVGTVNTGAQGDYRFDGLIDGLFFVRRDAINNLIPMPVQVATVTITPAQSEGLASTGVDTFDQTAQTVRDPADINFNIQDSSAAPEAVGGERDMVAALDNASAGNFLGAVSPNDNAFSTEFDGPKTGNVQTNPQIGSFGTLTLV
ncbi:MAG: hypothetical protein AAFP90_21140, partial [Planctomycetota bacterium]